MRTLPCCVWEQDDPHSGPIQAHHPIGLRWGKGMSTKSADALAIPLCAKHHRDFHSRTGWFRDGPEEAWQDYHVERVSRIPTK